MKTNMLKLMEDISGLYGKTTPSKIDGEYDDRFDTELPKRKSLSRRELAAKAFEHAEDYEERYPEGEEAISKDGYFSLKYAQLLNKPFPLGEKEIARYDHYSYVYASFVLKKPFPEGEASISNSAKYSFMYATEILKKRFPLGEDAILADGVYRNLYNDFFKISLEDRINEQKELDKTLQSMKK